MQHEKIECNVNKGRHKLPQKDLSVSWLFFFRNNRRIGRKFVPKVQNVSETINDAG